MNTTVNLSPESMQKYLSLLCASVNMVQYIDFGQMQLVDMLVYA